MTRFLSILLLALSLTGLVFADKGENPEAVLAKGIAYYEQGLTSSAIAQFSKAIDLREKYAEAHFWRGLTLIEMNEMNFAYASLTRAVQLRKDYPEAHLLLWLTMAESGVADSPQAYQALEAAGKKPINLPRRMRLKLAEMLSDRGLISRAADEFRQVDKAAAPPPVTDSYFVQQLDRNIESIKNEIQERQGRHPDAYLRLARALASRQDLTGAVAEVKQAIEQRKNFADAYMFLSSLHFLLKDYPAATAALQSFIEQFPADSKVSAFRSRIVVIRQAGGLPETPVVSAPDVAVKVSPPGPLPVTGTARDRKVSGAVTVEATFTNTGTIENPVVVQGLGYGLDERAVQALMGVPFEPAMKDGKPVAARQRVQINFTL